MLFKTLYSGSSGNCHYIKLNNYNILIDCGGTKEKFTRELLKLDLEYKNIDYCLITHEHGDHCSCSKYLKKTQIVSGEQVKELPFKCDYFETYHDSEFSFGYVIDDKIAVITDTGITDDVMLEKVKNCKLIAIESNYDYEELVFNSIPYRIKQRILSDKGHLSNKQCLEFLNGCNNDITVLIHISKDRNKPEKILSLYPENKKIFLSKTDLIEI